MPFIRSNHVTAVDVIGKWHKPHKTEPNIASREIGLIDRLLRGVVLGRLPFAEFDGGFI